MCIINHNSIADFFLARAQRTDNFNLFSALSVRSAILYTLYSLFYTLYFLLYSVACSLQRLASILYPLASTLYSVRCFLSAQCENCCIVFSWRARAALLCWTPVSLETFEAFLLRMLLIVPFFARAARRNFFDLYPFFARAARRNFLLYCTPCCLESFLLYLFLCAQRE